MKILYHFNKFLLIVNSKISKKKSPNFILISEEEEKRKCKMKK